MIGQQAGIQLWTVVMGGISTLAIYSFLIKENAFYRIFEHVFIGISAGLGTVLSIRYFLWPQILVPMFGLDIVEYPDGTYSQEYNRLYLLYLLPMAFGMLYYFLLSRRFGWVAKLVIGFSLGAAGGLAFKGFFAEMLPQLFASFKPLIVFSSKDEFQWAESLNNTVFVATLLIVMYYFFFSFKLEARVLSKVSLSGRWLMMVCFGAFFGSTVMARMALLVERIQFLLGDWVAAVHRVIT